MADRDERSTPSTEHSSVDIPRFSMFIPAYNAAKTIESVLKRIPDNVWQACDQAWVISRGSNDGTEDVVERLKIIYPKLQLFSESSNDGYGGSVRRGMKQCLENTESPYIVSLHGDGQYPPEQIGSFLQKMALDNLHILQGSRHHGGTAKQGGMPLAKIIGGKALTWIENHALGLEMTDYHSGYMFYTRHLVESLPMDAMSLYFDFDLEAIACARALELKISEHPIATHYGEEESNLNVFVYTFHCLGVVRRYLTGYYTKAMRHNGVSI